MCPFCGRDPFHRPDSGEAVAVVCCDLGDMIHRGARPEPEEVTIPWADFTAIAGRLALARQVKALATDLVEHIRDEGPAAKEWEAISAVTGELGNLLSIPLPE